MITLKEAINAAESVLGCKVVVSLIALTVGFSLWIGKQTLCQVWCGVVTKKVEKLAASSRLTSQEFSKMPNHYSCRNNIRSK